MRAAGPLSNTGTELWFEIVSERYKQRPISVTANRPFDAWTESFGTERVTGVLLDCCTHSLRILEMNGESYRPILKPSFAAAPGALMAGNRIGWVSAAGEVLSPRTRLST